MVVRLELKSEPDGFGYIYGEAIADNGDRNRVNILPPVPHWRGDIKPSEIDPTKWIIYFDGDEVARIERREDLDTSQRSSSSTACNSSPIRVTLVGLMLYCTRSRSSRPSCSGAHASAPRTGDTPWAN
jgi:hypothetical protein